MTARVLMAARLFAAGAALLSGCGDGASSEDGGARQQPPRNSERDAQAAGEPDGGSDDAGPDRDAAPLADAGGAGSSPDPVANDGGLDCPEVTTQLPDDLSCTGLYIDVETKRVASDVREFAPSHELWSDGADKQRWIHLPEGTRIDSSDPDEWRFPVGTRLFKEFSWNGKRVETRVFWKTGATLWLKAAYHWNEDETAATRFAGGEVDVDGDSYYIPSAKECDQCHKGRADRALGFELISLALPGASGMTLAQLIDEDLLTDAPAQTELAIGDDGSGHAAPALAWLHVNCGVSCHNGNPAAEGYASDLRLRLPAEGLDGRSSAEFDAITTTVGVATQTPRWLGRTLITPGSPEDSWLYVLASTRDASKPKDQMPPIASRRIDEDGLMQLATWIRGLPATP
jgi:hypothetical protein